jgi:hypothetical protein
MKSQIILMRAPHEIVGILMENNTIAVVLKKGPEEKTYSEQCDTYLTTRKRYNEMIMLCIVQYGFEVFSEEDYENY